jgi:hypothetical protein
MLGTVTIGGVRSLRHALMKQGAMGHHQDGPRYFPQRVYVSRPHRLPITGIHEARLTVAVSTEHDTVVIVPADSEAMLQGSLYNSHYHAIR